MGIHQVVGGQIMGVRGVGQDRMPGPRFDGQNPKLSVTRPEILRDAEQDAVSVRQHLGPAMPLLLACRIWRSHPLALSAALRDPRQTPSPETTQVDIAVRAP